MPKVTITFNLPEDNEAYEIAHNASNLHAVLWDYIDELRNLLKYDSRGMNEETIQTLSDDLWELLKNNDVASLF